MPLNQKSRIGIVVKSKAPLESPNDLHSLNIRRTGSNLIFYLTLSKFLRIKFPFIFIFSFNKNSRGFKDKLSINKLIN
jgi:hypothetical protein